MQLKKLIVHELQKESGNNDVRTFESNQLIPIDNESISLLESLLNSYKDDKILYAEFNSSPGKYFPKRFKDYTESTRTDDEFIRFSIDSLGNLVQFIEQKTFARGGYLVFAEYVRYDVNFITIFLIRDIEGKLLKKTNNSFMVQTIEYLDTSHLAMACRINESKFDSDDVNYLSFTRLKQAKVSDYFIDWISVEQLESSTEYTNTLYSIINGLPTPFDPETNRQLTIDEVRNMVYENAKNNQQRNINLRTISEQVYGNPNLIIDYAEQNDLSIDTEFRYNKRALDRFIKLYVNRDGINLKFSRGDLGSKIRPSEENEDVIIIESQKFADELKKQLEYE